MASGGGSPNAAATTGNQDRQKPHFLAVDFGDILEARKLSRCAVWPPLHGHAVLFAWWTLVYKPWWMIVFLICSACEGGPTPFVKGGLEGGLKGVLKGS